MNWLIVVRAVFAALPDIVWLVKRYVQAGDVKKEKARVRKIFKAIHEGDSDTLSALLASGLSETAGSLRTFGVQSDKDESGRASTLRRLYDN